jgi:hypothetical protein
MREITRDTISVRYPETDAVEFTTARPGAEHMALGLFMPDVVAWIDASLAR